MDTPRQKITPPSPLVRQLRSWVTDHRSVFALLCAIIGISVGAVAVLFQYFIVTYTWLATGYQDYGATGGAAHGRTGWNSLFVIAVPALSGLVAGLLINPYSPFARGHGVPEVMLAVRRNGGQIPGRVAMLRLVGAPITIGGGGPVGKEGPIVQIGASIGSFLGRKLKLSARQLTLLAGAGAAAGIAATFNTPLAGAVFALEVILVSFTAETIGMVVMAAVFGAVVAHEALGDQHVVAIPEVAVTSSMDLWWVVVVALIASLGGLAFSRSIYLVDDLFSAVYHGPNWLRPAVGGLIVGVGLYFVPHMYGDVTHTLHGVITGEFPVGVLLVFLLTQILLAALVLTSGGSGGVFGPTLFVGATVGAIIGAFIAPLAQSSVTTFAVIGMAAAFGAAARAPLTAVLIIMEMTGQYALVLPLMLAVGLATGLSQFLTRTTIYTEKLIRRGDKLDDPVEKTLIGRVRAAGLMGEVPAIVGPQLPIKNANGVVRESGSTVVPVVDDHGVYRGTLSALALARARDTGIDADQPIDSLHLPQISVKEREFASVVLRTLVQAGMEGIAVVDDDNHLVGWIAQRDLVERIYRQQQRALDEVNNQSSWGMRITQRYHHYREQRGKPAP